MIDHKEAKRIADRFVLGSLRGQHMPSFFPDPDDAVLLADAYKECSLDLRSILKAWGLGESDQMDSYMLAAFLRQFGKAPTPSAEEKP